MNPNGQPLARRRAVGSQKLLRIAAGAGVVATLWVCQGAGEEVPTVEIRGKVAAPNANWQPTTQCATQPATEPTTQPATQPVKAPPIAGGLAPPTTMWRPEPGTQPGK